MGDRFIVGGDFDAKNKIWGFKLKSPRGRQLLRAIEVKFVFISTEKLAYFSVDRNKTPDLIDLFVFKIISCNSPKINEILEMNSDHTVRTLVLTRENI